MAAQGAMLNLDGVVLRNLQSAMYKMSWLPSESRVTSLTSLGEDIFIGAINEGCYVISVSQNGGFKEVTRLCWSEHSSEGETVYEIAVSKKHLVYIKESEGKTWVCVHRTSEVLAGKKEPLRQLEIRRRASLVLEPDMELITIGGQAWTESWVSGDKAGDVKESDESHVLVLDLNNFEVKRNWKATDNSVAILRAQQTTEHSFLGVADSRTGLKVYDMRQADDNQYVCLYQVPVEEIRNFKIVGNFLAVFHKFEPNVSFWNMVEHKTILCINIQDQMRELAEEILEDDLEDDLGMFGDDDDHVTSVISVPSGGDFLLLYGTKSGCVFGMSVEKRTKLFNIPCPHESSEGTVQRRSVQGITFVAPGKVTVWYERQGLTVLDFSPENPPDRPPTRCQKRPN